MLEIGSPEGNVHHEPMDIPVYEAAPPGNQVMDNIVQLVSALDRNRIGSQGNQLKGLDVL